MSNEYEIREPRPDELEAVQRLRHLVLDPARSIKSDETLTAADFNPNNLHMAAFHDTQIVSTLRMDDRRDDDEAGGWFDGLYVVKVATDEAYRGLGLAARVLSEAEEFTSAVSGIERFRVNARIMAAPFFSKLGYVSMSEVFTSTDGVPNLRMQKEVV